MLTVARRLEADQSLGWDALNTVFTQDSRFWRDVGDFREVSDASLVHRIARSYRKAHAHSAEFFELLESAEDAAALSHRQAKLNRWTQLAAHQLELLRPQLSEKGKAQAWYLDKLADTLRMRMGLVALGNQIRSDAVVEVVNKSTVKIARRYAAQQLRKMDQRLGRLAQSCFTTRPKKMRRRLAEAGEALAVKPVSLRSVAPVGASEDPPAEPPDAEGREIVAPAPLPVPEESTIERAMRLHTEARLKQDGQDE